MYCSHTRSRDSGSIEMNSREKNLKMYLPFPVRQRLIKYLSLDCRDQQSYQKISLLPSSKFFLAVYPLDQSSTHILQFACHSYIKQNELCYEKKRERKNAIFAEKSESNENYHEISKQEKLALIRMENHSECAYGRTSYILACVLFIETNVCTQIFI